MPRACGAPCSPGACPLRRRICQICRSPPSSAKPSWPRCELGLNGQSRKADLLRAAGRATTITVQDEALPYRYVSVEGPVEFTASERDVLSTATRYLGAEIGAQYAEANPPSPPTVVVRLPPEHWRTQDFSAAGSS